MILPECIKNSVPTLSIHCIARNWLVLIDVLKVALRSLGVEDICVYISFH